MCAPGWRGATCESDINECTEGAVAATAASSSAAVASPCDNGGQCVNTAGSYRCVCSVLWTGQRCQLDVLECQGQGAAMATILSAGGGETVYCLNNGTCLEQAGALPKCVCPAGECSCTSFGSLSPAHTHVCE